MIEAAAIPSPELEFLTPAQLCARWQLSERTLERWRKARVMPCYKLGGKAVRYRLVDVEAFEQKGWRAGKGWDMGCPRGVAA
jgi:hypothetical protein